MRAAAPSIENTPRRMPSGDGAANLSTAPAAARRVTGAAFP